ncbi:glucan endo-1,3-beta-glucosidase 11-like [Coffea arabica]|uniref:Glucan endo-1,3-beta-glucosidase 11-like n=1 Tax=Coffea arabica TaxID=13443 RepID=A0A6P6VF05_COFAR
MMIDRHFIKQVKQKMETKEEGCCCCCFTLLRLHNHRVSSLLLILFVVVVSPEFITCAAPIAINYGQIANNLPSPESVVPLVKSIGATRLKLYDADPTVLKAFANTGVEFIVSLGNQYLSKTRDPKQALAWVKANVQPFLPATRITCIAVGNEVLTFNDTSLSSNLLPAMQSVYSALCSLNLQDKVSVTTAHSLAVLQTSYPPSAGRFRPDLAPCLTAILNFHLKTGSPFLINAYPYFAYKANPKQVPLEFVLFQPNPGILDPATNLHYDNMLFAQIDAVHSAVESLGFKDDAVCVQISETGWPSKGDADEAGATPENAKKYNGNLINKLVCGKKGTPMRPNADLNIYVFALFNENMKSGPTSERNYGLFKPDGSPAYYIGFNGTGLLSTSSNTSSTPSSTGSSSSSSSSVPPGSSSGGPTSSTGYLSITSDAGLHALPSAVPHLLLMICWLVLLLAFQLPREH